MTLSKRLRAQLWTRTVSGVLAFTISAPALAVPGVREPAQVTPSSSNDYRNALADYALNVRQANQVVNSWIFEESRNLNNWSQLRGQEGGPNEDFDMLTGNSKFNIVAPTLEEMQQARETQDLVLQYYGHQGSKRFLGTFVESGSPYADGQQWDTQRWAGIKVRSLSQKLFDKSKENDLINIRIGVNVHDIDLNRPDSIEPTVNLCIDAWKRGISPTLSMLFFSSLKQWETKNADGSIDPARSYLNHPDFPADSAKIAEKVLTAVWKAADQFNAENEKLEPSKRLPYARVAVNPVNEPETFAGFQHFWHGAFAKWGDPNMNRLYVPAVINIAKANVAIRMAAEKAAGGRRTLFFHNEAMTPKDYPSHKGDGQFAVSKFMLGDEDLMKANLDSLASEPLESIQARFDANKAKGHVNVVEWAILAKANVPANTTTGQKMQAQLQTVRDLKSLRDLHLAYTKMTTKVENGKVVKPGKTAKTDTIIMLDYYQQSEFILPKSVPEMIRDFSEKNGEMLKKILFVQDDRTFMKILEERARQAETLTGQKLWQDYQSPADIDFKTFLAQEDGIILDKLIGLRNEWNVIKDPVFEGRRQRAGLSEDLAQFNSTDEKRTDALMNELLGNRAQRLKSVLQVSTDADLMKALRAAAMDTSMGGEPVALTGQESLREILNKSERSVLHRLLGLERFRRTGFLPPHYARQTRAQLRKGLYETYLNYIAELKIRVGGIGESGTPYYPWAAMVHKQMIMAAMAAARKAHMYFVRYDLGPLVGTIGWMNGPLIGNIKTNGKRAQDGIMKLVSKIEINKDGKPERVFNYELSVWPGQEEWFKTFKNEVLGGLDRVKAKIDARTPVTPLSAKTEKSFKLETNVVKLAAQAQHRQVSVQCAKVRSIGR